MRDMLDMLDRLKLDGMFLGCTVPLSPGPLLGLLILPFSPVPNMSVTAVKGYQIFNICFASIFLCS